MLLSCGSERQHIRQHGRGPGEEARDATAEKPRSGERMSKEKEGIHQVPGEQGGGAREPKQSSHRRAEIPQRTLLPTENRMRFSQIGEGLVFVYRQENAGLLD